MIRSKKTILICGSRTNFNEELAEKYLVEVITANKEESFIHGGAIGIDTMADNILYKILGDGYYFDVRPYTPQYERYGKYAPLIRDELMVDNATEVIALWNNESRGTKHTIEYAKLCNKPLTVYDVSKEAKQ